MPRTPGFKDDGNSRLSSRRNFGVLLAGTALLLAGCNTVGASPAPSETAPTSAPASPGSATPGASETSAAEIPNSNIKSLKESAEYKALSPEKKAIIDKYDDMNFAAYTAQVSPDRYFYSSFAFGVYHDYAISQINKYHKETNADDAKLVADVLSTAGNGKPSKDASGQQIASAVALRKATAIWSSTRGGDTAVVPEKVATAKKMLADLSVDAFQTEAPSMDSLAVITSENDGLLQVMSVGKESASFIAPRTGETTKIMRGYVLNTDSIMKEQFYAYTPISPAEGAWVRQYTINQGQPGYLTDAQILDKASLEHNSNI